MVGHIVSYTVAYIVAYTMAYTVAYIVAYMAAYTVAPHLDPPSPRRRCLSRQAWVTGVPSDSRWHTRNSK